MARVFACIIRGCTLAYAYAALACSAAPPERPVDTALFPGPGSSDQAVDATLPPISEEEFDLVVGAAIDWLHGADIGFASCYRPALEDATRGRTVGELYVWFQCDDMGLPLSGMTGPRAFPDLFLFREDDGSIFAEIMQSLGTRAVAAIYDSETRTFRAGADHEVAAIELGTCEVKWEPVRDLLKSVFAGMATGAILGTLEYRVCFIPLMGSLVGGLTGLAGAAYFFACLAAFNLGDLVSENGGPFTQLYSFSREPIAERIVPEPGTLTRPLCDVLRSDAVKYMRHLLEVLTAPRAARSHWEYLNPYSPYLQ